MSKKTRNLKPRSGVKNITLHISGFKNLNYDDFSQSNRFASVKSRRRSAAGLNQKQSFFDRRFFRPERNRLYRYDFGLSHLSASLKHNFAKLSFERPKIEPICRRRNARRRVLFAFRLTGKGAAARKHSWTQESKYSCKS